MVSLMHGCGRDKRARSGLAVVVGIVFVLVTVGLQPGLQLARASASRATRVWYAAAPAPGTAGGVDPLLRAIRVDPRWNVTGAPLVGPGSATTGYETSPTAVTATLLARYDVIVVVDPARDALLDPGNATALATVLRGFVERGGGLVLVGGPRVAGSPVLLELLGFLRPGQLSGVANNTEDAITGTNASVNPFTTIDWNSCPAIARYTVLPHDPAALGPGCRVSILKRPRDDSETLDPHPLVLDRGVGSGRMFLVAPWLASAELQALHLWPYFNYFVYSLLARAGGDTPAGFADWQYSPVPHAIEQVLWIFMIGGLVLFTVLVVHRQRKRSRQALDAEALAKIAEEAGETDVRQPAGPGVESAPAPGKIPLEDAPPEDVPPENAPSENAPPGVSPPGASPSEASPSKERLGADASTTGASSTAASPIEATREAPEPGAPRPRLLAEDEIDEWEEIGYHRQLAGFLFALFMSLLVIGPQLVLTLWIYPNYILPFPQAAGYYSFVLRFFEAFWLFLDFGTSVAAAKFFAQYRVHEPEKAVRYVQIYIWWQLVSGIGQFATVSVIGLFVFPHTQYAHMSWFFILHSMIQFPGFLAVLLYFFQGVQKLDTAQFLEVLKTVLFTFLFQYVMIMVMRAAFRTQPRFGEVFGAVVGMAIGGWISEFVFFGVSFRLFKKQGYAGTTLFRIDFTKAEIKETFKYGARLVAGNVWVPLVWFLQVILLSIHVTDYSSEMAYFEMAYTISQVMALVGLYLNGMMPPISEAIGNDKRKLLDLGVVELLRVTNWLCYFIGVAMLVVGNRIILGFSGPTWSRATVYFLGLLLHAVMGPYSWAADRIFQGTGRTDLNLYTWILEQGVRAVAVILLIPRVGVMGVVYAYNLALASKDVAVWILIRRKIWHGKVYPWKTFVAPALSAGIILLVFESLARVLWDGGILTTLVLVLATVLGGIYLSAFLAGFFGLWDDHTLADFAKAARMVHGVGGLARALYKCAEVGATRCHSPFHKLSPIDIYDAAMAEARALTREKRVLDV